MLLADHALWHSWGETILWIAAVATALGFISRTKPVRWVWRHLVTEPMTAWSSRVVSEVVETKVTKANGGESLRDRIDAVSTNQDDLKVFMQNLHECMDRRFTDTHTRIEKLTDYAEEVIAEALGAKQRIRQLYRALDVPVFETDANGRCSYINPAYSKLTGLAIEEAMGEGWKLGVHPEDRDRVVAEWEVAVGEHHKETSVVYRVQNLITGVVTHVKGVAAPLHDAQQNVVGWVGMIDPLPMWDNLGEETQEASDV